MKKWFQYPENKVKGFYLKYPYNNIFIGCDPCDGMTYKTATSFDAFVNVSDSPCNTFEPAFNGQAMHWYPVNEMGRWNLSYLYWLKKVLDFHHRKKHRIYLHCHAGAYRSPSAALLWLQSRGVSPERALKILKDRSSLMYQIWEGHGNIHPLKDELFKAMRKCPKYSLFGAMAEACRRNYAADLEIAAGDMRKRYIKRRRFAFYYIPKWWLKRQFEVFHRWAIERLGYFTEGCGTYYYPRKHFWAWGRDAEPMNPREEDTVFGRRWNNKKKKWVKVRKGKK